MSQSVYYIIGDVHGQYQRLLNRLKSIGLIIENDEYRFNSGKILFLGDLVDRGSDSRKVVTLVKKLHELGICEVILGNHEFNLIGYLTPKDKRSYLRRHTRKNSNQCKATLKSYKGHKELLNEHIEWLKTLPLFFENEHFRAVHACWDQKWVDWLKEKHPKGLLDLKFFRNSYEENKKSYWCIERLLKGPELNLIDAEFSTDSDGQSRKGIRYKWWKKYKGKKLKELATKWNTSWDNMAVVDTMVPKNLHYTKEKKPLFIGHYNFVHQPDFYHNNFLCLDCSDKAGNRVLVYRHEAGAPINKNSLLF